MPCSSTRHLCAARDCVLVQAGATTAFGGDQTSAWAEMSAACFAGCPRAPPSLRVGERVYGWSVGTAKEAILGKWHRAKQANDVGLHA